MSHIYPFGGLSNLILHFMHLFKFKVKGSYIVRLQLSFIIQNHQLNHVSLKKSKRRERKADSIMSNSQLTNIWLSLSLQITQLG